MAIETFPEALARGAAAAVAYLRREELDASLRLRQHHTVLFRTFREELQRHFLEHYVIRTVRTPDGEPREEQAWDLGAVARDGTVETLVARFGELTAALVEADEALFAAELERLADDGFEWELGLLALGGVPIDRYWDDRLDWAQLLLVAGVAGLSWRDRLRLWGSVTQAKLRKAVQGAVVTESTLPDTLSAVDRLTAEYDQHLTGLLGNELKRAFDRGGEVALARARQDAEIAEVWVTRDDPLVCPVCAAKHLTVTPEQPVDHSHPGCRCRKVPVPAEYREDPEAFAEFLRRKGLTWPL